MHEEKYKYPILFIAGTKRVCSFYIVGRKGAVYYETPTKWNFNVPQTCGFCSFFRICLVDHNCLLHVSFPIVHTAPHLMPLLGYSSVNKKIPQDSAYERIPEGSAFWCPEWRESFASPVASLISCLRAAKMPMSALQSAIFSQMIATSNVPPPPLRSIPREWSMFWGYYLSMFSIVITPRIGTKASEGC